MKKISLIILASFFCFTAFAKKTKQSSNKKIKVETTLGSFTVELYADCPLHSANFLKLVQTHFYDSLLFHRIIKGFMIQGGDPTSKNAPAGSMLGSGGGPERIPAEFTNAHCHKRGSLCAARDMNPEKASSNCQFYIVDGKKVSDTEIENIKKGKPNRYSEQQLLDYKTIGGTPFLDDNYTVYGEVVEGMETIEKIASVAKNAQDRPNEDVRILSMKELKKRKKFLGIF